MSTVRQAAATASRAAAIAWRADRAAFGNLARCDRWYVTRGSRWWLVCPPCYCDDEHRRGPRIAHRFLTHADAIIWADRQARAERARR